MGKVKAVSKRSNIWHKLYSNRALYLLLLPSVIILFLFTYMPMYGVVIAFKDFSPAKGIMGSSWAGLKYFKQYFNSYQFWPTIKNTLVLSIYSIAVTFPLPILLALVCNQMRAGKFKKFSGIHLSSPLHIHRCHVRYDYPVFVPEFRRDRKASEPCGDSDAKRDGASFRLSQRLCVDRGVAASGVGQHPVHSGALGN